MFIWIQESQENISMVSMSLIMNHFMLVNKIRKLLKCGLEPILIKFKDSLSNNNQ